MSSHHSDQISQRSQVSRVDLCVHHSPLTHLLRWVTRSPIELLWTAKNWAEWKQLKGQEGRCKCGGRRSWVAWCGQPCIPSTADPRPHYLLWQPCPHPTMVVSTFLSTGSRLPSVHSVSKQSHRTMLVAAHIFLQWLFSAVPVGSHSVQVLSVTPSALKLWPPNVARHTSVHNLHLKRLSRLTKCCLQVFHCSPTAAAVHLLLYYSFNFQPLFCLHCFFCLHYRRFPTVGRQCSNVRLIFETFLTNIARWTSWSWRLCSGFSWMYSFWL